MASNYGGLLPGILGCLTRLWQTLCRGGFWGFSGRIILGVSLLGWTNQCHIALGREFTTESSRLQCEEVCYSP